MTSRPHPAVSFWYDALHDPRGIFIKTHDPIALKSILYTARKSANDPALFSLMIRHSPTDPKGELWIIQTGNPEVTEQ